MSASFLVYNDETGDFLDIDDIQSVELMDKGSSKITLKNNNVITSPLKAREILRRISIIRYKRGQNDQAQANTGITVVTSSKVIPGKSDAAGSVDTSDSDPSRTNKKGLDS